MKASAALLVPAVMAVAAHGPRYARLGDAEGAVEVRLEPGGEFSPARRNLPLAQNSQVRTGASARVEMEFDDGGALRLGPESLARLCDHLRLSTGQTVTLIALERGLAYLTAEPGPKGSVAVIVPGGQVALRRGARLRLEAAGAAGQVAVMEGEARLIIPAAEFDLREGQTARIEEGRAGRFELYREVPKLDLDAWSEQRDRILAVVQSAFHAPALRYGLADLDAHGTWIDTAAFGPVWKPAAPAGWAPFRAGKWEWYDGLGYTWVSAEPWGWLPYHYGRWTRLDPLGWVWAPGRTAVFSPGAVYWMRGPAVAGWGPLAPGESWSGSGPPQLYASASTTFGRFQAGARAIDPENAVRPKDPLASAQFAVALISPPLAAPRAEPEPPRAAEVRFFKPDADRSVVAVSMQAAQPPASPPEPPPEPSPAQPESVPAPAYVAAPPPYEETYFAAPVYTGIIVVNPPERHGHKRQPRPAPTPPAVPAPRVDRGQARRAAEKPAPRAEPRIPRAEQSGAQRRSQ